MAPGYHRNVTGRSPARLLAPLALVTSVLALYLVVSSGGSDTGRDDTGAKPSQTRPSATSTTAKPRTPRRTRRTYTVRAGDTPSGIAERVGISLDTLLELNPDVDPQLLSPGQRLKLSP